MIRINLLPNKKKSRGAASEGERNVAIGMGILAIAAAAVFFLVHSPMQDEIEAQVSQVQKLKQENKKIENRTKDFDALKAAFKAAQEQAASIEALNNARSTPANFLFELSNILRADGQPTMTAAMTKQLEQNENLRWQDGWDPEHLWIQSIREEKGAFTLTGSAQSDSDVTQLAHRLAASMYFQGVQPEKAVKKPANNGGMTLYNFTITGRVRY